MKKPLIIGVGNRYRSDDAAGLAVAKALEETMNEYADIAYCSGDAMEALDLWKNRDIVFIIDSVSSNAAEIGELHRFAAHDAKLPAIFSRSSTHLFGIGEVIELAKALNQLPKRLFLYGIEGKHYAMEEKISPALEEKLPALSEEIAADIQKHIGECNA